MINNSTICPGFIGNAAPLNNPGKERIKPKKEAAPERIATIDKAETLPITNSLRFIGVSNKLARVPLSFSPEIDSGHIDMTVEYSNDTVTIGIIKPIILASIALL